MPHYQVFMGQGAVVNLNQHGLYTGPPPASNALQFCTAVIFINRGTQMAGLYHFPSGRLKPKHEAVMEDMLNEVSPDIIALRTGGTNSSLTAAGLPGIGGDTGIQALREYLGILKVSIDDQPANSGAVAVSWGAGAAQITPQQPSGALQPLESWLAGDYPAQGVKVYGKAE